MHSGPYEMMRVEYVVVHLVIDHGDLVKSVYSLTSRSLQLHLFRSSFDR